MKRFLILFIFAAFQSFAQSPNADSIGHWLVAEKYDAIIELMDSNLKSKLTEQRLKAVWQGLVKQEGAATLVTVIEKKKAPLGVSTSQTIEFSKAAYALNASWNAKNEMSSFFIKPTLVVASASEKEGSIVIPLPFKSPDGYELKGELWLPQGTGPFPIAILVHGRKVSDERDSVAIRA